MLLDAWPRLVVDTMALFLLWYMALCGPEKTFAIFLINCMGSITLATLAMGVRVLVGLHVLLVSLWD